MKFETPPGAGCRKAARVLGPGLATGIAILALVGWLAAPAAGETLGSPIFAGNFESGTICAWSSAVGWGGAPCVALQIDITEGGAPLGDGALFNRDVVPVLDTTGGTAPVTLDATLDGVPFTSGSTVTGDALHLLEVSAEDADGLTAQRMVHFTIDTVGPVFVNVAPPEGFVTSSPAVVLSGEVSGATTLTVNGAPVGITNDQFSSDPLALAEGAQSFLLVASDLAGNPTPLARNIVRDSLSPGVTISQPAPGVVGSSPITVAGTATDPHLAQVLVNGQAAAVAGASYSLTGLALVEGSNAIVVEAFDALGNPPGSASVAVTLDTQEPVLTFLEGGLPLTDGALFNRTVVPIVVATDATQVNLSVTLNGAPFASGTPVADEGSYTLQATAVDEGGNSANLAASFAIDATAPSFIAVLPPDNTLVAVAEIALGGEVAGAQSVTVDGLACTVTAEAFACPSFPMADGERIFNLVARDAAGNEAPRQHRIRRDGTGPEVVIATPAEGAFLASANVTVSGTAVDPHLAEVRVNGVLADLAGDAWSVGPLSLAEGAATIEVIARDAVDNATVVSRGVTIDTVAPEVDILESGAPLGDGALFNRTVTPVIEVTDASPWTVVATLDGAPYVSGTPVASEGLHVLQATATDSAGNPGTRQTSFRVDGSPPALVAISPADGFVTAEAEVHLQGQILGAETLAIDGVDITLLGDQFIAGPYPLAEGERTFAIVALDAAGNELHLAHRVIRDITAPTVSIQQPAVSALVGTNAVQVSGQAADPHLVSVAVNGVAAALSGSTWVAPQVPLGEGESTLVATAVDRAGNSATASRVAVRDSQAPAITITDPATGSVVPEAAVEVSGSVDDPNLDRVTVQGVTAAIQGGSFSANVALAEGDNTLVVRATDRLGHAAEVSLLVRRDSTAPGLEIETPEEGSQIAAEFVAVSGTIGEEGIATLTVNGVSAAIAGNTFAVAAVPLVEGENRLIARGRDANGNEGVRTRTVVRDTVAPTILGTEPPAGALAIALATVFVAELSEEPGPPSVGGMHLETDSGTALAATVEIFASGLRLIPSSTLPSSSLVRLLLEPSIVDLAGNGLVAGATFEFTTADATAPAPPAIPAPPARFLCSAEVVLAGFAEPDRWVEVAGGAGAVRARAASDGEWSVAVPLIPGAIHRLAVTSVDDAGNRSLASEIEVVHDCAEPVVERVDASASGFAVQFSEEIEPASFAGSVLVSGAAGAIDGSVELDVDLAIFTAASPLPEGAIRVEVLRQPRDLAGNLMAYPWVSVFGGDAAESFFVATVIDDAVGRPLAGARARVLATNGVPPSGTGPALESTSAGDGTVSVPVPVGTHIVLFEHPDFTPVFRFVTTQAQQGTDIVDPRLAPLFAAVAVGPAGGTVAAAPALSGPFAELEIPAGALADPIAISLTELSEQGLPRLLPFGWSPRAAVWIGPEEAELLLPARLVLPVDAIPGSTVAWVHLDPETRVWRVEGVTALGLAELDLPVAAAGAWVVVEADPPPFAVPTAVIGEPLGSLPTPPAPGETLLGATLAFDPETVLPGQRSRATVDYTATEAAASGSTVTLSITEELQLLDGTTRTEPPYRADLVVYRTTEGARSRFFLASSEAARLLPIELGEENVTVLPYGGEIVRGNVVGPPGGSVLDPSGDRIDIPAGALVRPTPVQLEPVAEGTLPLPLPEGFAFAGALRLDLSGETLLEPANLFLALAEAPPAGETGILFGVESFLGGGATWRPLATISPSGSGWQSDAFDLDDPEDLAWPGVTRGGSYLFARALAPFAFVRGTVFDVGGARLANASVASTGATAVEWLQLSGSDGRYAYPAWVGPVALTATKPSTGDQGSGSALLSAGGERVDLDLALVIVRPSVVSTTPASGATAVPVGIEPVVQFSEPVERLSLAAAITLRPVGGAPVALILHHLGSQVTLEPEVSLEPAMTYELVIGEGVYDLQGHGMAAPVTVSFTTQNLTLPSTVDLSRVLLYAPGTNGESRIQGLPGAAPAGTLVFVENLTRLAATISVAAEQDGSFELSIVAQVTDRLLLHVLIAGANEVVAILGPFRTADGRGAYVGTEGSIFTTIDGWTFSVPADTFDETSVVHVVPHALNDLPAPLPASFVEGVSFVLDFGGATPDKAIELALPAPAGVPAGRPILVLREMRAAGVHGWMLHELATQEGGRLVTLERGATPFAAELFSGVAGDARGGTSSGSSLAELAAAAPGAMLPGIAFAGNYTISWTPEPLGFLGFPTTFWNDAYVETALTGIVTVLNGAIESLLEHDAVLIPTLLGVPVAVTVHDAVSGFVLYEGDFSPPPGDGGIAEIPPEVFGDTTVPHPLAGSPLRLFVLDAAEAAGGELDRGVSYLFAGDSVEITGASGSVSGEARVRLLGLDDARSSFTTAAADGAFELQAAVSAGNRYLLALGARIDATAALEIAWSEPLGDGLGAIRVLDDVGRVIGADVDFGADRSVFTITPRGGWPTDRDLRLELGPAIADASGNRWEKTLEVDFRARASQVVGHYPFAHGYDVARLGELLLLAAGQQGLAVLDASDPSELANVMPGGLTFPLPFSDIVRALAVDPHGRVLVAGGGVANFGVLRVFDPLALPGILAAPDPAATRGLAWRGTTIVSDRLGGTGTQLPAGTPRKVALYSDDLTSRWRVGEPAPDGLVATFTAGEEGALGTLAVSGNGAAGGAPVSLRNLTRAGFARVDADGTGGFNVSIAATSSDRIELLRNRATIAYLATLGAGIEVVDVNAFYDGPNDPPPATSRVVGIYSGLGDSSLELCNESVPDLASALIGLDLLIEAAASPPIDIAALVGFRGIAEIESPPGEVGNLSFLTDACAEVEGSRAVRALASAVDFPWDLNGDGLVDADERERDYAFVTHATGGLLVFDLTQRSEPQLVARVRLPLVALGVAIDRARMRAYVSGASGGLAIVDLATLATTTFVDADENGVDDRVLEVAPILEIQPGSPAVVLPDLGLVFVGGDGGAASLAVGVPEIIFVAADGSNERLH